MKSSLALLVILLFLAFSIGNDPHNNVTDNVIDNDIDKNTAEGNQYLLHAESSERLLNIMQQISPIAGETSLEEPKKFTEEDIVDLIEAVEELLFYSELMSIKIAATEMEESKSVIFSAMASKLYSEALNIQQLSKNYDLHITDHAQEHVLDEAFTRLSQTCIACHQLFRDN